MDGRKDRSVRSLNLHLVDEFSCAGGVWPELEPADALPRRLRSLVTCPRCTDTEAGVHLYLDDHRIENTWTDPERYVGMLRRFACVMTPDYSLWLEMPEPMKRWQVYRSLAVGKAWQDAGLCVVPTLTWGGPDTFSWCFDGIPKGGTVSLSTVGLMRSVEGRRLFDEGADAAMEAVSPSRVLAYGTRREFDARGAEVVWYESDMQRRFDDLRRKREEGGRPWAEEREPGR